MLSFLHPWVLLALAGLPLLWRLLNALPPAPLEMPWPPTSLLGDLRERTPPVHRPPWWLVMLRLLMIASLIFAAAGPRWHRADGGVSDREKQSHGTIWLVIDDGFASAEDWTARQRLVRRLLARFGEEGARFVLIGTAPRAGEKSFDSRTMHISAPIDAYAARAALESMVPVPFAPAHAVLAGWLAERAANNELPDVPDRILWVSDGQQWKGTKQLTRLLARLAPLDRLRLSAPPGGGPYALLPPERDDKGGWRLAVVRPPHGAAAEIRLVGLAREGSPLGTAIVRFSVGATRSQAHWKGEFAGLPLDRFELRDVSGARGAARVWRLDLRSRSLRIGIVAGPQDSARPFASPVYYLERALRPFGTVSTGALNDLLARAPDVLVIADRPKLAGQVLQRLSEWLARGGLLIRFAGPAYGNETDPLHPLPLARGARVVGGRLSWERPHHLAPFSAQGAFAGLATSGTVEVRGQVLALPGGSTSAAILARLDDGTPLISSVARGQGRIVFFHTSADAQWTNLPIDPLFPALLRRVLWLAPIASFSASGNGTRTTDTGIAPDGLLTPRLILDGFGGLVAAPPGVKAIPLAGIDSTPISPMAPAGLYGAVERPFVRNLQGPSGIGVIDPDFHFTPDAGPWTNVRDLLEATPRDLAGPAFLLALLLLVADIVATGWLKGWLRHLTRHGPHSARIADGGRFMRRLGLLLMAVVWILPLSRPLAQTGGDDAAFAIAATRETRIGYIPTGDPARDERVRAGLSGLGRLIRLRTSVRLGEPMAVDPTRRPLALFALVYWMPSANDPPLSPAASVEISRYLAAGGILFIDLGIDGTSVPPPNGAGGTDTLSRLLGAGVMMPPLVPLDERHILARSFYLLDWFPGRGDGAPVWVSADSIGSEPKVSPIVIGRNDWVGAWALDGSGGFLVPELAGGLEQREYAFRFGVNLVIYALAGTYKGDRIHLDAILERLKR